MPAGHVPRTVARLKLRHVPPSRHATSMGHTCSHHPRTVTAWPSHGRCGVTPAESRPGLDDASASDPDDGGYFLFGLANSHSRTTFTTAFRRPSSIRSRYKSAMLSSAWPMMLFTAG